LSREGIDQVFFVFKKKFSPEQIRSFNLFKNLISESGITKFTTLVRTNFPNFRNSQECREDRQDLLNENKEIYEIINSCNSIIHVDNPPIPEVDEEDSDNEEEIMINKKDREDSRQKILTHLVDNCREIYKLKE